MNKRSKILNYIKKSKKIKWFLVFLLGIVITYNLMILYVDAMLGKRAYADIYQSCYKVWATRGLVLNGEEPKAGNSIETLDLAFKEGARGTEVDLFYDPGFEDFIISHDFPYNLKNDKLLTLEELIANVGRDHYFWLDFKKMRKLDYSVAKEAARRLLEITREGGLKERIYVEGGDPINLSIFRKAGFKTIYDTHPLPDSYPFTSIIINLYKSIYYFGDFSVMAMKHGNLDKPIYGSDSKKYLNHVPLFIYHVPNDSALINSLLISKQVRVLILQDHGLNQYNLQACDED